MRILVPALAVCVMCSRDTSDEYRLFLGAFTPGCQGMHVPGYIEKLSELRGKGVDIVAIIAFNDAFVMSAWGKINGMKDEDMVSADIPLEYLGLP